MKRLAAATGTPSDALTDLPCACATARQVARVITQFYDSRLRETGMEAPQFALLMTLHKQGPGSQAGLGRRYALDKTTVSRNLKWLEKQGWIAASAPANLTSPIPTDAQCLPLGAVMSPLPFGPGETLEFEINVRRKRSGRGRREDSREAADDGVTQIDERRAILRLCSQAHRQQR